MLILWGGWGRGGLINTHFGSEVGIASANTDPGWGGGGQLTLTFGSEVGSTSGNADPGGG